MDLFDRTEQVRTGAGHRLAYDRLVLATGAAPRRLALPGADLRGVLSFRDLADTRRLQGLTPGDLVVVGGGFLGLEAAEALLRRGHRVTLVHGHGHPLNQQLDAAAGARLRADLEARGLRFVAGGVPFHGVVAGLLGQVSAAESVEVALSAGNATLTMVSTDPGLVFDPRKTRERRLPEIPRNPQKGSRHRVFPEKNTIEASPGNPPENPRTPKAS